MGGWLAGWLVGNTLKLKPASYAELGKIDKISVRSICSSLKNRVKPDIGPK